MSERLLTLTELAAKLARPRGWLWRLVKTTDIPVIRIGRTHFFREAAVDAWFAARETKPATSMPAPLRKSLKDEAKDWGLEESDLLH